MQERLSEFQAGLDKNNRHHSNRWFPHYVHSSIYNPRRWEPWISKMIRIKIHLTIVPRPSFINFTNLPLTYANLSIQRFVSNIAWNQYSTYIFFPDRDPCGIESRFVEYVISGPWYNVHCVLDFRTQERIVTLRIEATCQLSCLPDERTRMQRTRASQLMTTMIRTSLIIHTYTPG